MKVYVGIGTILFIGVCLGAVGMFLCIGGTAQVAADCPGTPGTPCANGDVNASGGIDIADAVYVLSYLFAKGALPAPIAAGPCSAVSPPATGQTKCYDDVGNEIDCASADFPGQDGFYQAGCPMEGRFLDNFDGTVTDTRTGLMWQKDTADVSGNGSIGDEDSLNWQGALKYCENLSFAGHDDWRLPNVNELHSIIDYGRWDQSIDPGFGAVSSWYWSSTSTASNLEYAWLVKFESGAVGTGNVLGEKDSLHRVRAVRSGL